jgi:Zn-dependent protease with chaperone function
MRATIVGLVLLVSMSAVAHGQRRGPEYDQKLRDELAAQHPDALAAWDAANAAREKQDFAAAIDGYQKVIAIAPKFDHAHRRLCGVLAAVKRDGEAKPECEAALSEANSPENRAALAIVLAHGHPSETDLSRAGQLASSAAADQPNDPDIVVSLCVVGMARQDQRAFTTCARRLAKLDPDGVQANYMLAIAEGMDGHRKEAFAALERARRAGLDDRTYAELKSAIEQTPRSDSEAIASHGHALAIAGWIALGWAVLFALLLLVGWILSRLVLREVEQSSARGAREASEGERRLRRVYGMVIRACGLFFYVSIPLVLVAVVGLGGGLLYAIFAIGEIPIKLVLIIIVFMCVTVWSVLRSLFVRGNDADPGVGVDLAAEAKLRDTLHEVAGKIGTAPVDAVFLTAATDVGVFERGGMWRQLRGRTQRCLVLGVGVLDGMRLVDLKAILGHEYGHLKNADTASGGLALMVRRSMITMMIRIARGGAATWYNPAWWFLRGYHRVFLRVSHGASRLQEVLADRWAATAYGSEAFERGLRHVVDRSVRFEAHINTTLNQVVKEHRGLANLYTFKPAGLELRATQLDRAAQAALERPADPYDSHPAPLQRIAWVRALAVAPPAEADDTPAWALFRDRQAIETQLTREVRDDVAARHGVVIAPADVISDSSTG